MVLNKVSENNQHWKEKQWKQQINNVRANPWNVGQTGKHLYNGHQYGIKLKAHSNLILYEPVF